MINIFVFFTSILDFSNYIDKLLLSIKPGEYLGIVGKSGCGNSTLMRLLLGLEKQIRGGISHDSIDINSIEPRSLRGQIGCVLQELLFLILIFFLMKLLLHLIIIHSV